MDNAIDEDPLGFTRQTKMLLIGLGHENIVDEVQRRNISTEELPKLSREDLIILGVADSHVDNVKASLNKLMRKSIQSQWMNDYKFRHILDVFKDGHRHLVLIQSYLKFCRLKLLNDRNTDVDNDADESKALFTAAKFVIKEFSFMQDEFCQLKNVILKTQKRQKSGYVKLCVLISTLGLTGSIIFYVYKR